MPTPKKATAAKKSSKKAAAPIKEEQVITEDDVDTELLAAEPTEAVVDQEAEARRAVAQQLLDDGYAIVNAGQDEDGRHWFLGSKAADDGDKPVEKKVYVEGAQS